MATYAQVLGATLQDLGLRLEHLTDTAGTANRALAGARRWSSAAARDPRRLSPAGAWSGAPAWAAPDLFREAQAHFSLHGQLLPLDHPDPPAVMHWTYPLPMTMRSVPNIYTIHDVIPWERPDLTGISRSRHLRLLQRIRETASLILTVSEHSRESLLRLLDCPLDLVVNTYQPPPPAVGGAPLDLDRLKSGGYFLFFGSVEPRKNIARLVAAHRMSNVEAPLVIAGPDGWRARRTLPAKILADQRLIRLSWLERPELTALIAQAKAVLFPSLAEGFGLPVLEAMALGAPVLTSNRGALAEIAGDGALLVDPEDAADMARAIAALATDESLLAHLRVAGAQRATVFSVQAYADRLASAYARVIQDAAPSRGS